ncbi:MAG: cytochrome c maturation protein CcmE [Proteobacteria bacterium]|nr:cytochrome c maturation protein CcmE [Pseudomonadota bacterium]
MTPRRQRMLAVGLAASGILIATALTLEALKDNMMFFISVTDFVAGDYPADRNFRIGGLVVDGSIQKEQGTMDILFRVTDLRCEMSVTYSGVRPDLFGEGQGVVAHGRVDASGMFVAETILAKHDENYMAPEVAASLAKHVNKQTADLAQGGPECDS